MRGQRSPQPGHLYLYQHSFWRTSLQAAGSLGSVALLEPEFINFPFKIPAGANLTGRSASRRRQRLQVTRRFLVGKEGSISYQSLVEHLTVQFLSRPPDQYLWNSVGPSRRLWLQLIYGVISAGQSAPSLHRVTINVHKRRRAPAPAPAPRRSL